MSVADFGGPALMSGKEVFEFLNVSKAHFYKTIIKADDFPKPIDFYGSKRWYTATIKSWLNNKLATHWESRRPLAAEPSSQRYQSESSPFLIGSARWLDCFEGRGFFMAPNFLLRGREQLDVVLDLRLVLF